MLNKYVKQIKKYVWLEIVFTIENSTYYAFPASRTKR